MNNDELVKGGQGRCADELAWNAKLWLFCIVLALLLAGCAGTLKSGDLPTL